MLLQKNLSPLFLNHFFETPLSTKLDLNRIYLNTIKIKIKEESKNYLIEALLPAVKKENVNIQLDNGKLTINVKDVELKNNDYTHFEWHSSYQSRTINIPKETKEEDISAQMKDGVLFITINKTEKFEPKKIEIL